MDTAQLHCSPPPATRTTHPWFDSTARNGQLPGVLQLEFCVKLKKLFPSLIFYAIVTMTCYQFQLSNLKCSIQSFSHNVRVGWRLETRVISLVSKKIFKKLSSQKNGGRLKLSPAEETTILFCPGLLSSEWRSIFRIVLHQRKVDNFTNKTKTAASRCWWESGSGGNLLQVWGGRDKVKQFIGIFSSPFSSLLSFLLYFVKRTLF